jgi:hypothetical protein
MKNSIVSREQTLTTYTAQVTGDCNVWYEQVTASDMIEAQHMLSDRLGIDPDDIYVFKPGEQPRSVSRAGYMWNTRDLDLPEDNPGFRPCNCEDYPCCGH